MEEIKITNKRDKLEAFIKNKRVGYLKYSYPNDDSKKRNMNIDYLFIFPKYRRQRIGIRLINYFLNFAKNKKIVWVSLWTSKDIEKMKALSLYKKTGFKKLATQKDYYERGISTTLFVRRLR